MLLWQQLKQFEKNVVKPSANSNLFLVMSQSPTSADTSSPCYNWQKTCHSFSRDLSQWRNLSEQPTPLLWSLPFPCRWATPRGTKNFYFWGIFRWSNKEYTISSMNRVCHPNIFYHILLCSNVLITMLVPNPWMMLSSNIIFWYDVYRNSIHYW
jgi:hypothetical protein